MGVIMLTCTILFCPSASQDPPPPHSVAYFFFCASPLNLQSLPLFCLALLAAVLARVHTRVTESHSAHITQHGVGERQSMY